MFLTFVKLTLAAPWRMDLSGATVDIGRTLGICSGAQDEMMAMDLGVTTVMERSTEI